MNAKSSSVWAFKGQNVPRRSLRFLLMLPSTLSGYTKYSNFTPVWKGTDGMVWKSTPYRTVPQPTRGGAALGQKISRPLQHGPRGRNEMRLNGKWPVWDFCGWICNFMKRTETSDWSNKGWIYLMESHPFFHFANEKIQVISLNTFFTAKVLGTWTED